MVYGPFGAKTYALYDHQKFMKSAKSAMDAANSEPVATSSHVYVDDKEMSWNPPPSPVPSCPSDSWANKTAKSWPLGERRWWWGRGGGSKQHQLCELLMKTCAAINSNI